MAAKGTSARLLWIIVFLMCHPAVGTCQRIMIDAGHSPQASGAKGCSGKQEYFYNTDLSDMLATRLRSEAHTVAFTPIADLTSRAASSAGYDFLISIHHDSVQPQFGSKNHHTGGFCTNKAAGFSIFVSGNNREYDHSLALAKRLGMELVKRGARPSLHHAEPIRGENRTLLSPELGIYRFDGLRILSTAQVPALLLEVAVITNPDDEKRAASPDYQSIVIDSISTTILGGYAGAP